MPRMKLGVLISGRGSNMQSIANACADPDFPAEIALILSNRADAAGLDFAAERGIPTAVVDHKAFPDRDSFEAELTRTLEAAGVEFVCLAGFMRILNPGFVSAWHDRLINIHPSLLPAFKGLHTHERVLEAGARFTGCTVHFVRPEMDAGPIIIQAAVPVLGDDTPDTLSARVLVQEHRIYPEAVRLVASGDAQVSGDVVVVKSSSGSAPGEERCLINPSLSEN